MRGSESPDPPCRIGLVFVVVFKIFERYLNFSARLCYNGMVAQSQSSAEESTMMKRIRVLHRYEIRYTWLKQMND